MPNLRLPRYWDMDIDLEVGARPGTPLDAVRDEVAKLAATRLNEAIIAKEGRTPTPSEVRQFGCCAIHLDGRIEYKWRGDTILVIDPIAARGLSSFVDIHG